MIRKRLMKLPRRWADPRPFISGILGNIAWDRSMPVTRHDVFVLILEDNETRIYGLQGQLLGLMLMFSVCGKFIEGAGIDIIYGPRPSDLIQNGITEAEVGVLGQMGWFYSEESGVLAHFV